MLFPISRDPPEGGTRNNTQENPGCFRFPISRDPPEGGTVFDGKEVVRIYGFQFLGIPPKGELTCLNVTLRDDYTIDVSNF